MSISLLKMHWGHGCTAQLRKMVDWNLTLGYSNILQPYKKCEFCEPKDNVHKTLYDFLKANRKHKLFSWPSTCAIYIQMIRLILINFINNGSAIHKKNKIKLTLTSLAITWQINGKQCLKPDADLAWLNAASGSYISHKVTNLTKL